MDEPASFQPSGTGQPATPAPRRRSPVKWLIALILLIIIVIVVILLAARHSGEQKTSQPQPTGQTNGEIRVGNYRYVNACQALTPQQEQQYFANLSSSALVNGQYAEASVPANQVGKLGVISNCSRDFASGTPYDGTTMTFSVNQFATTQAAHSFYTGLQPNQAEANKANQLLGTNLQVGTHVAPLSGVANTLYDPDFHTSYTLDGNKILSFSARLGTLTDDQFKQSIAAAVPAVKANADNPKLKQTVDFEDVGKKLGDATYQDPCAVFTASDFRQITGTADDPADVEFTYQHHALQYPLSDTSTGDAHNRCARIAPAAAKPSTSIDTQVEYFKSASEASQMVAQHMSALTGEGFTLQTVKNIGQTAFYEQDKTDPSTTAFDVQQGPYVLELRMFNRGSSQPVSVAEYTKAAQQLLPKLH